MNKMKKIMKKLGYTLPIVFLWIIKKWFSILILFLLYMCVGPEIPVILISSFLIIAFYTVLERRLMASIQRRHGPNLVGIWGFAQALADGIKLFIKQINNPYRANRWLFITAPILALTLSLSFLAILPISSQQKYNILDSHVDLLILFALSSINVYSIILSGWSSNSKYAFLGALSSSAQMISYEVFFSIILLTIVFLSKSMNLVVIVQQQTSMWYIVPCAPLALIFFISILAESNSTPFDLPEAEAESVAGYNVEYSAMQFALFFLAEYGNMFSLSYLFTMIFCGGWLPMFGLPTLPYGLWALMKTIPVMCLFVIVRANFPRYSYDQLMKLGWKVFLPFTFAWFLLVVAILS